MNRSLEREREREQNKKAIDCRTKYRRSFNTIICLASLFLTGLCQNLSCELVVGTDAYTRRDGLTGSMLPIGTHWQMTLKNRNAITHKKIAEPNFIIFELFSVIPAL